MAFKDLELRNVSGAILKLEALEVALSSDCNFNCKYCGAYRGADRGSVLKAEEVIEIIAELPDLKRIRLSGGEVTLLFEDCRKIVEFCTSRGIASQINTNASLLDTEKIDLLDKAGLGYMHFSLNHVNAESHHRFYRVGREIFPKIVNNVQHVARKTSIEAITETILFEETIDCIDKIYYFVHELGVRKLQIQTPVQQRGWWSKTTKEKIINALSVLISIRHPDTELYFTCFAVDRAGEFFKAHEEILRHGGVFFPSCIEGKSQLHLHSNGDVLVCDIGKPTVIGNIRAGDSLKTIMSKKARELESVNLQCPCTTWI